MRRILMAVLAAATVAAAWGTWAQPFEQTQCSWCSSQVPGWCITSMVAGHTGYTFCDDHQYDCHDGTQGPCAVHCHLGSACVVCLDEDPHDNVCDKNQPCEHWYSHRGDDGICYCSDVNNNGVCDFSTDETWSGSGGGDGSGVHCQGCGSYDPLVILDDGNWNRAFATRVARFDMDADGDLDVITWSTSVTFVAIDENEDGLISSGAELLGNAPNQAYENGFEKLKALAGHGGVVDGNDPVWQKLRAWRDFDGDAVTDPGELTMLSATDIVGIDTDYKETAKEDKAGNDLRFRGTVLRRMPNGNVKREHCFDIILEPLIKG